MTDKNIGRWDPHNLLQFIEHHKLDEFAKSDILKLTENKYFYQYYDRRIDEMLLELLKNGYVTVNYTSDGRKTVAKYKYVKRELRMITNDITIDIESVKNAPDGSITDAETIRQIGLLSLQRDPIDLSSKIRKGLEVAALYPHIVRSYNLVPDYPGYVSMKEDLPMPVAVSIGLTIRSYTKEQYENILNIYVFGSHVYGTATKESDVDIIMVVKKWFDSEDINVHVYTVEQFQLLVNRHDIQAMECLFSPEKWVLMNEHPFHLAEIDKYALRTAVSTITSNSWVKGKKKLIVAGDYDMHLAIKSIFHSLRILDYGIQIATSGRIENFGSMNFVMEDLRKLSKEYQREELWNKIDDKYRKMFNEKTSQFKLVAPKDLSEKDKKAQLHKILVKYVITPYNNEIITEILDLFQK